MVPTQSDTAQNEAIASIPRAVRTVNLSVLISLLSLVISLFTLFWNIRPARVEPFMSEVFASEDGGLHLSIPLSIVNRGAHSATVLAAKLYESDGGLASRFAADFTADPDRAVPAMTGSLNQTNVALWVPIAIPGNGQVQRVFIFRPDHNGRDPLIAAGRTVSYDLVLLLSGQKEVAANMRVTWPAGTNGIIASRKGGVGTIGGDVDAWLLQSPPTSR